LKDLFGTFTFSDYVDVVAVELAVLFGPRDV
jgi:hypothetical protein